MFIVPKRNGKGVVNIMNIENLIPKIDKRKKHYLIIDTETARRNGRG